MARATSAGRSGPCAGQAPGGPAIQRALAPLDPALRERGVHVPMAARIDPGLARHANLLRGFPRRCSNRVERRSREAGAPREGTAA